VLRDSGRGNTSRRVGIVARSLVVFQIVVTCVLLIGALLQVRSITQQQTIDYGYDTGGVVAARVGLMEGDYPSSDARRQFFDRVMLSLSARGDFAAVALTNRFRMVFSGNGPIELEGKTYAQDRDRPNVNFEQITGTYFDVTNQRLVEGRTFTDQDTDTRQPVAIVNAAFAKKHYGNESAMGRRFRTVANNSQPGPWRTIVGVVSTVRMLGPFNNPNVDDSGFYVPFTASVFGPTPPQPVAAQFATVVVRPRSGSIDGLANTLRSEMVKLDPNLPLYFVGTPKAQIESFVAQNRIIAVMFAVFGGVAVLLAAVGIYGVLSFSVNQRTQEFGVRMALGADRRRILGMVLRQSAWQVGLGALGGLLLALTIATLGADGIQSVLFNVNARDPLIYGVVIGMVILVSMFASLVPARRATRVDPIVALRD